MAKRRRAAKVSKTPSKKSGFPAWVKPTAAMILGGGVGLIAMSMLPDAIGPYAPALGVLAAKFVGGGGWSKYLTTAGVVGGVTFLSRRKTIVIASGALAAAKRSLASGGGTPSISSPSAAAKGNEILRKVGV